MEISNKVLVLPNICGIEIDAQGFATPSISPSLQPFYNTIVQNSEAKEAYFSPSKIKFNEEAKQTRAGLTWSQTLSFQFPSNDPLRLMRIKEYIKAKYIYIKLSGGMVFYFGRNDFYQNAKPKINIKSNNKITQISYSLESAFAIGFTNGSFDFNLEEGFPVNFYNL